MDTTILSGKVIQGQRYGRTLGFPTANIDRRQYMKRKMHLPFGIYAGFVILPNNKRFKAGIVIGPLDNKNLPKLEAHLLNFTGNLYGTSITLELHRFIRKFKAYPTVELLKKQIQIDIQKIKRLV